MAEFFAYIVLGIIVLCVVAIAAAGVLLVIVAVAYVLLVPILFLLEKGNKLF